MKPAELGIVNEDSEWYAYTPSRTAVSMFFHPLRVGWFHYEPGYRQERNSFDSFLIMMVRRGAMEVADASGSGRAARGDFVLLDCYSPHSYRALEDSEVVWLHFDGVTARSYYRLITERMGVVGALGDPAYAMTRLQNLYEVFHSGARISEPLMSKQITDLLTEFAVGMDTHPASTRNPHAIEDVLTFIAGHLSEPLSVADLAARAYMSEYHFIRVFKRETGYTPHQYVVDARLQAAKYRLAYSDAPLRQVCEDCGFGNVSSFCALFRRRMGLSPMEFRGSMLSD